MNKRDSGLPFSNPVADSFELMKKMWGFAGLPGIPTPGSLATAAARIPQQLPSMLAPTLDVNELEKRIADLRAVEQWLELNASMLRTTIQSLEVQRATIATLKGITGAMMAPILPKAQAPQQQPPEVALGLAAMKQDESKSALSPPPPAPPSPKTARKTARRESKSSAASPTIAAAALNPTAWWNALQDQFVRVSGSAAEAAQARPDAKSKKARRKQGSSKPRKGRVSSKAD